MQELEAETCRLTQQVAAYEQEKQHLTQQVSESEEQVVALRQRLSAFRSTNKQPRKRSRAVWDSWRRRWSVS